LTTLVKDHQASIYRYLRYLGADTADAEDLAQDTFLAAFRSNSHPDLADARLRAAWLRGISRNLLLAHFRRGRANPVGIDSDYLQRAEEAWTREFLGSGDELDYIEALRQCLRALPEKDRRSLDLRYGQRKSRAEMARLRRMTEDGIKSMMRRIRSRLADCVRRRLKAGGG